MIPKYIVAVATLVLATLAIESSASGYGRINEYLIKKIDNDDAKFNLEAAVNWLKEEESAKHFLSLAPIKALKKFTSLKQISDSPKCDMTDYKIMKSNEGAVGLYELMDAGKVIRRVDKVMLKVFEEHSEKCSNIYPMTYRSKREQLDEIVFNCVKTIADSVMEAEDTERMFGLGRNRLGRFPRHDPHYLTTRSFALRDSALVEALKNNAINDPNVKHAGKVPNESTGKEEIKKVELTKLVKKHLIEPCQQFVNTFGRDVFIPAMHDALYYEELDDARLDYYFGWLYFKICHELVKHESSAVAAIYFRIRLLN